MMRVLRQQHYGPGSPGPWDGSRKVCSVVLPAANWCRRRDAGSARQSYFSICDGWVIAMRGGWTILAASPRINRAADVQRPTR
jgi:hypothetical protein